MVKKDLVFHCWTLNDILSLSVATGRWFSPVSSTNKTDRHDITEILLKVAFSTINLTKLDHCDEIVGEILVKTKKVTIKQHTP